MSRPIYQIARDIQEDWRRVNFAAVPYLESMYQLKSVADHDMADSAKSVVAYFLANASTYRGPRALALKNELRELVDQKPVKPKGSGSPRRFKGYQIRLNPFNGGTPFTPSCKFGSKTEARRWANRQLAVSRDDAGKYSYRNADILGILADGNHEHTGTVNLKPSR